MVRKLFNPATYTECDTPAKELIEQYSDKLIIDTNESYGIDCTCYMLSPFRDGMDVVCYLELEVHKQFKPYHTKGKLFPYNTLLFFKHKVDKYSKLDNSFYIKFSNDFAYVAITPFVKISTVKQKRISSNDGFNPYVNDSYEDTLDNTFFCKTEDYEEAVIYYLTYGEWSSHDNLNCGDIVAYL